MSKMFCFLWFITVKALTTFTFISGQLYLSLVVQKLESAIHRISYYLADKY